MSNTIKAGDEYGILTDPTDIEADEASRRIAKAREIMKNDGIELNAIVESYQEIYEKKYRKQLHKVMFNEQILRNYANHKLKKDGKETGNVLLPYAELKARGGSERTVAHPDLLNQPPNVTEGLIESGCITVVPEQRRLNLPALKKALKSGQLPEQVADMVSIEVGEPSFSVVITDLETMLGRSKLVELPEPKEETE